MPPLVDCGSRVVRGLYETWHENGRKVEERAFRDGEEASAKYWICRCETVETWKEVRR